MLTGTHSGPGRLQDRGVLNIGDYQPGTSFESKVRDFKFNIATNAIPEHNGNKTVAAHALRISRAYLHRLIRGPESEDFVDDTDPERETALSKMGNLDWKSRPTPAS